ncbi:Mor transcription activator family protein [Vibrio splendidus]|uniref:Mor transcription activator family protein n=1 Tax=Vibrio splendidus TaxID=29497 RepID=UPI00352E3F4E
MISVEKAMPHIAKALTENPDLFSFDELDGSDVSYPELLEGLHDVFEHVLQKHGIDNSGLTFQLVFELMQYGGGVQLYIPKPDSIVKTILYKLIAKEFDGSNFSALARRYSCSTNQVRRIVNATNQ